MSIVTISRGSYSRGKEVAEALAEELGYECISREILVEASHRFNIPEIQLARALHDSPSIFDHFQGFREQYLDYFKSSFLQRMLEGNVVYHGLAGHFFLQGIDHALKIRINARMSDRVLEEMKREHCSDHKALARLKKDDKERRLWSHRLFGQDTWDSRLYDMVLQVDSLTVQDIVEILAMTVRREQFQETRHSAKQLAKRALLADVKAMAAPVSPHAEVRIVGNSTVELSHLDGRLKCDADARRSFTDKVRKELEIDQVIFREPPQADRAHINTFYNLDL